MGVDAPDIKNIKRILIKQMKQISGGNAPSLVMEWAIRKYAAQVQRPPEQLPF